MVMFMNLQHAETDETDSILDEHSSDHIDQ